MELNDVIVNQPVVIDNVNISIYCINRLIFCRIGVYIFRYFSVLMSYSNFENTKI